jgi:ATP synthase protein I
MGSRKRQFVAEVQRRHLRHEKHLREGDASFWSSVGMMGTIGWSVSLPCALGALLGRWVDARLDSAHIFLVFFMLVGLGVGCFTAWRLISEKL